MLAGGAAGAFGAWISGGNILQGALTGAIVAGLNCGLHDAMDKVESPLTEAQKTLKHEILKDGELTLSEANLWAREGGGHSITINASSVDLSFVDDNGWKSDGTKQIETLIKSTDGLVQGGLIIERVDSHHVKILRAPYDFEPAIRPGKHLRNFGNWVAKQYATHLSFSEIQSFDIIYKGLAEINTFKKEIISNYSNRTPNK
ncbi:MAG: hypothetical protein KA327_10020 [Pseudarcicella sp.]|nr:hypothetical protein [Pseudarcicella sp.]